MILRLGPVGVVVVALVAGFACGIVRLVSRTPVRRALMDSAFVAYTVTLFVIVFLESSHFGIPGQVFSMRSSLNLVPLQTIGQYLTPGFEQQAFRQIVGNVLIFVPLGLLLPGMNARFRAISPLLATACIASVGIELTQLALLVSNITVRSVDVDDVILNTLGAAIGYVVWLVLSGPQRKLAQDPQPAPQEAD